MRVANQRGTSSAPAVDFETLFALSPNPYVLLNPAKAATRTVNLGGTWQRIDGTKVTSVTLAGGRGAVLLAP